MDLDKCPMVRVTWYDAQEGEAGWLDIDMCINTPLAVCQTVGWLVENNDKKLTLMTTVGKSEEDSDVTQGGGCTSIPQDWATNIEYLYPEAKKI